MNGNGAKRTYGEGVNLVLRAMQRKALSSSEIAAITGMSLDRVCATVCHLFKTGRVVKAGSKRNPKTTQIVNIWKVNPRPSPRPSPPEIVAGVNEPKKNFSDRQLAHCFPLGRPMPARGRARRITFK